MWLCDVVLVSRRPIKRKSATLRYVLSAGEHVRNTRWSAIKPVPCSLMTLARWSHAHDTPNSKPFKHVSWFEGDQTTTFSINAWRKNNKTVSRSYFWFYDHLQGFIPNERRVRIIFRHWASLDSAISRGIQWDIGGLRSVTRPMAGHRVKNSEWHPLQEKDQKEISG